MCIGNGQVNDAITPSIEVCKTLNCMVDPMKIMKELKDGEGLDKYTQED